MPAPSNDELCRLCREGKLFAVQEWFKGGGKPEFAPKHRRDWAMGIAIEKGFHSLVEVLLRNGSKPTAKHLALASETEISGSCSCCFSTGRAFDG